MAVHQTHSLSASNTYPRCRLRTASTMSKNKRTQQNQKCACTFKSCRNTIKSPCINSLHLQRKTISFCSSVPWFRNPLGNPETAEQRHHPLCVVSFKPLSSLKHCQDGRHIRGNLILDHYDVGLRGKCLENYHFSGKFAPEPSIPKKCLARVKVCSYGSKTKTIAQISHARVRIWLGVNCM